ncbi:Sjogren's syndrome/scleroderma autoantigen 1 family protein [Haloarchaeobius salinus]|uniref:Sjogren's syndrome/scleroderma autoantigen 1 family protein n=1 Tax=Haloarchaeobius salinus TaxID=1198298 RepID=UPI002108C55C|nr:Sjogren's syndrome/scleroderma autoantigen 1 family protein [Haloarchaeobius salinus]
MSEEFDKEAEREKLREQFATEEQEREQTRRMSELLLKGATMTNRHCDRCGDPIFRQNGQEFCPSCQGGGQPAAEQQAQQQQSTDEPETEPAPGRDGASEAEPTPEQPARTRGTTPAGAAETPERTRAPAREHVGRTRRADDRTPVTPADAAEFDDAAAAIEATIRRFSEAAANTDDPERAREYLRTVREATETLAALQGR